MKKAIRLEIEGTDGSSKTTSLKYICDQLEKRNWDVLRTREVGCQHIPTALKLREVVLSPESDLSGEAMELIFAAMRLENDKFYKKVEDKYDFIVSDRGFLSHMAYTDHNISKQFTSEFFLEFLKPRTIMPDIVIYLDVSTETALKRRIKRGEAMDVIEQKGIEFQEKVKKSFNKYINDGTYYMRGVEIYTVDANQDLEGVQKQLDKIIDELVKL